MASIPAAHLALGPNWDVAFETRCLENVLRCLGDVDGIYFVTVWRSDVDVPVEIFCGRTHMAAFIRTLAASV